MSICRSEPEGYSIYQQEHHPCLTRRKRKGLVIRSEEAQKSNVLISSNQRYVTQNVKRFWDQDPRETITVISTSAKWGNNAKLAALLTQEAGETDFPPLHYRHRKENRRPQSKEEATQGKWICHRDAMYYEVDAPSTLIPPLTYVFVVPTFVTSVIVAEFLSRGFVPFVSYFISSFRGITSRQ